jgi:hypothetical protein
LISKSVILFRSAGASRSIERGRRGRPAAFPVRQSLLPAIWVSLLLLTIHAHLLAQPNPASAQPGTPLQVVKATVENEEQARRHGTFFRYTSVERSARTGGHLWTEKVVETPDGLLRRLVAEDGKPLPADRAAAEDRRITALVIDPSDLRAANAERRADEARLVRLLNIMPQAFLFTADGMEGDCMRIAFRPNPAFTPSTYDERIVHGLAGVLLVHMPAERLCGIQGHLVDRVTFGYGLLGHVDLGSHFSVTRVPVTATDWKSSKIAVHVDGRILLLKSISRDEDATHSNAAPLPPNLSLKQAAALTQRGSP